MYLHRVLVCMKEYKFLVIRQGRLGNYLSKIGIKYVVMELESKNG